MELNLSQGTARQTDVGLSGVEFPSFDRRFTGEPTPLTVLMQTSPASLSQRYGPDRVLAVTGEQVQAYSYGPDWIAEEHLYVPRPNGPQAQPTPWPTGLWHSWRCPTVCRWACTGSLSSINLKNYPSVA